jgi:proton glutamate symport protein
MSEQPSLPATTDRPSLALHWQILLAILLAAIAGSLSGTEGGLFGVTFYQIYDFAGTLFLNALFMVIVPLIMASIITGIATIGSSSDFGRIGLKTLLYFMGSGALAILVGLLYINLFTPGISGGQPVGPQLNLNLDTAAVQQVLTRVEGRDMGDIVGIFLRMVPTNVIAAAAAADMLALIFFSIVFGFFMTRIPPRQSEVLMLFWQGVSETMMLITKWIMTFAPYGVFGLVARTVAATGFAAFMPMLWFFLTVLAALFTHLFVVLPLLLKFVGKVSPLNHQRAMLPVLLTAFSSASSSATLPVTMECVQKGAGVSERTASFVLPLGATVNMNGTALYECSAAIFLAQAYGLELGFGTQLLVVVMALLTSIGVAGIPAASLVAITVILTAIGLPAEAIGLLLVTDRILDMVRTAINVYSDTVGAVLIARSEKEEGLLP